MTFNLNHSYRRQVNRADSFIDMVVYGGTYLGEEPESPDESPLGRGEGAPRCFSCLSSIRRRTLLEPTLKKMLEEI